MGEYSIPAGQDLVWRGMNDPALLKRCITVCESFEQQSESLFRAVLAIKVGPFPRVHFTIMVGIENADPPYAYRLVAEGKGGIVGWAHATADVRLEAQDAGTRLFYDATANINGALGRLATTVLSGAIDHYTEEFFSAFSQQVVLMTQTAPDLSGT